MVVNDWLAQFLADALQLTVLRPQVTETTALGAAYLAGLASGTYGSLDELSQLWTEESRFTPARSAAEALALHEGWQAAIARVRSH